MMKTPLGEKTIYVAKTYPKISPNDFIKKIEVLGQSSPNLAASQMEDSQERIYNYHH